MQPFISQVLLTYRQIFRTSLNKKTLKKNTKELFYLALDGGDLFASCRWQAINVFFRTYIAHVVLFNVISLSAWHVLIS